MNDLSHTQDSFDDPKPAAGDTPQRHQGGTPTFVIVPFFKDRPTKSHEREAEGRLQEACGLAQAIDLEVCGAEVVSLTEAKPATLLGSGKVDEFKLRFQEAGIELVIVDGPLSPVQQRNLERAWHVKVLDRTGLILEIFGERAQTREGRLQVELAHLTYQKGRLVRSWTHLERQRGGLGFIGGPGETQIEADRRMIQERIERIERHLDGVKRTRELHRKTRRAQPHPIIALVGYTNAGKSTLFNRLTRADVFAENLLFATLDPTMRSVTLPNGRQVIMSDTVGFISDLPTHLVAAFRATLEEVLEADIILHVRDIAHPETESQKADVEQVLTSLGVDVTEGEVWSRKRPVIEVLNKIDLLSDAARLDVEASSQRREGDRLAIPVSAQRGEGLDDLAALIEEVLSRDSVNLDLEIAPQDAEATAWLYEHGAVLDRTETDEGSTRFWLRLSKADLGRFQKRFPTLAAQADEHPAGRPEARPPEPDSATDTSWQP